MVKLIYCFLKLEIPFVKVGLVAPSSVQIVSPFLLIAIAKSPELTIKILSLLYIGLLGKESNLFPFY